MLKKSRDPVKIKQLAEDIAGTFELHHGKNTPS